MGVPQLPILTLLWLDTTGLTPARALAASAHIFAETRHEEFETCEQTTSSRAYRVYRQESRRRSHRKWPASYVNWRSATFGQGKEITLQTLPLRIRKIAGITCTHLSSLSCEASLRLTKHGLSYLAKMSYIESQIVASATGCTKGWMYCSA